LALALLSGQVLVLASGVAVTVAVFVFRSSE
jgi:hypothetical protein